MANVEIEHFKAHQNDTLLQFTVTFDDEKKPVVATIGRYDFLNVKGLEQLYISDCSDWHSNRFHDTLGSALREVIDYLTTTYEVKIKFE